MKNQHKIAERAKYSHIRGPLRRFLGGMFSAVKRSAAAVAASALLTADAAPWKRIAPEAAGFDGEKLAELTEFIRENSGCTSMLVAIDGKIVFTYGDITKVSVIASCRKSVLSMLYGKYVADGTINLDLTVGELGIDDLGGLLPQEKLATVYDLVTSRSGVYHVSATLGGDTSKYERGKTPHGTKFVYNNWDFNVAGTVFTMLTGKGIYEAFNENLAIPLGLEDYDHKIHKLPGNAKVSKHLGYHFYLSARDMARLGELMRLNGVWNGQTLVPESWVRRSTSLVSPLAKSPYLAGYGILWWMLKSDVHRELEGGFAATGIYGQYIVIVPKLGMVVAFKSAGNHDNPTSAPQFFAILYRLLAARKKAAGI